MYITKIKAIGFIYVSEYRDVLGLATELERSNIQFFLLSNSLKRGNSNYRCQG